MTESEFNDLLDQLMMAVEDAIDDAGADIDYENAGGILTLTCDNDSQIILSRQGALRQLWMAARAGGFHFDFDTNRQTWVCSNTGDDFLSMLNSFLSQQADTPITLAL